MKETLIGREARMSREHPSFTEYTYQTAEELWAALSPTHTFKNGIEDFVYRGQGNAQWPLIPTILRPRNYTPVKSYKDVVNARDMVFFEFCVLARFVKHCDAVGIPIPNDSQTFRKTLLSHEAAQQCQQDPYLWPNPELLDLMAMAQHHGVPTRLLDWTTRAYTAAYFAASSALSRYEEWAPGERMAVWGIDKIALDTHSQIVLHHSPGSTSRHLAAQGGLFTVHPLSCEKESDFKVTSLEGLLRDIEYSPFIKLTLPVFESAELLKICSRAGINGATIYPSADGAGRAVCDDMNKNSAREKWNVDSVVVRG
ncbi:FRG domain-containing protein [Pseudomonas syringae]